MPNQVHGPSCTRHVRYRAVPRANRIPAPFSRAYQPKPTRVEGADIIMQSSPVLLQISGSCVNQACTESLVYASEMAELFISQTTMNSILLVARGDKGSTPMVRRAEIPGNRRNKQQDQRHASERDCVGGEHTVEQAHRRQCSREA
jgi:hypothetical protein